MSIRSRAPKSFKLIRLIKPLNPKPQSAFFHLATEKPSYYGKFKAPQSNKIPPSSSLGLTQIIDILKSNDKDSWKTNDELAQSLNSLSSDNFLEITRNLGNFSTALHFVDHLRSNPEIPDEKWLSSAFQASFELANRGDEVLELFEKSKEWKVCLNLDSLTQLVRCLSQAEMIEELMVVYGEFEPQMRDVHVRNVVIDALLKNSRLDDALQVLDEMLDPNSEVWPDENTMDIVFPALLLGKEHGRWVSEEEFVEMVARFCKRGLFPDSRRLGKWITSFCRNRRTSAAWELLHTVMELGGSIEVPSCNALLTGLNRAGEFDKMNCLMKEMQEKGLVPDIVTLGISINHLCKTTRVDEALDLFEKIRRGEIGDNVKIDVIIYNTLIDGLCKLGRIEEGLSMMRRVRSETECSPNVVTFNCLIDGICKVGEIDKALELFDEMDKEGVEPNIRTVNCMVSGLCRYGRAGGALKFYREMQGKELDGNAITYTTLISGFCGVNNIRKAMELLDEMKGKCQPDAIVYYTLISGLSQAGLMDEVESVLSEMKSAGFSPDIGCYNVMIHGFCQKNKLEKAHQLLRDMEADGVSPDCFTYNSVISYFTKIGDLKTSRTLLQQMIRNKVVPTVVTYGVIIQAFCSTGQLSEAMKIFKEIKLSAKTPPNTVIYNTLIDAHCRNNMTEIALSLFDEMSGKGVKPNTTTFNALFKTLREENQLRSALVLMDKMTELECSPDYITLEILTQWLSAVGESEKLRNFVELHAASASSLES